MQNRTGAPASPISRAISSLEESAIAILLGLMTLITFANVIARYVFNDNILWALEATVSLFAWLVLFGASYCVKIGAHIGVDVVLTMVAPPTRKLLGIFSILCCLAFSGLLLIGGWDYWLKFATTAAFLETNDIPMPDFLQFLAEVTNYGEEYEKLPRYIPYFILPFGMALLTFRFLQAGWEIIKGDRISVIASHEVEDLVEEAAAAQAAEAAEATDANNAADPGSQPRAGREG